jgi:hypothetical protein
MSVNGDGRDVMAKHEHHIGCLKTDPGQFEQFGPDPGNLPAMLF